MDRRTAFVTVAGGVALLGMSLWWLSSEPRERQGPDALAAGQERSAASPHEAARESATPGGGSPKATAADLKRRLSANRDRGSVERANTGGGVVTTGPVPHDQGERGGVVPGAGAAPVGELAWDEETEDAARCTLQVTVTDEAGAPLPGALVHVRREEEWETERYALVRTGPAGTSRITALPTSYYRLSIDEEGALPHTVSWRCDGGHDGEVALSRRAGGARLFGRVLEAGSDEPLAGAAVTVQEITNDKEAKDFKTYTFVTVNEDGGFDFTVPGGKDWQFRLYARAPGYEFTNADVFVGEGEQRRITFSLQPMARIEGTVLLSSGAPAAGARVGQRGPGMLVGARADEAGRFSMAMRTGRSLFLTAHSGNEYGEHPQPVRARKGETRGGLVIRLSPGRTLKGTVRTRAGAALPLAEVIVADAAPGGFLATTMADASGGFMLEGAPFRALKAFATGSSERTLIDSCDACAGEVVEVDLVMVAPE